MSRLPERIFVNQARQGGFTSVQLPGALEVSPIDQGIVVYTDGAINPANTDNGEKFTDYLTVDKFEGFDLYTQQGSFNRIYSGSGGPFDEPHWELSSGIVVGLFVDPFDPIRPKLFSSRDYCVEGWMLPKNPSTTRRQVFELIGENSIRQPVQDDPDLFENTYVNLYYQNSKMILEAGRDNFAANIFNYYVVEEAFTSTQWTHWAVTRDSNGLRAYINGQLMTNVVENDNYVEPYDHDDFVFTFGDNELGVGPVSRLGQTRFFVGRTPYTGTSIPVPGQPFFILPE
jgi:hypothetical protein